MKQSSYSKHYRSPSHQQDSLTNSSVSNNNSLLNRKADNANYYLSKFDDRLTETKNMSRSFHNDRSINAQRNPESYVVEADHRQRTPDSSFSLIQSEADRRGQKIDNLSVELDRPASFKISKPTNIRRDDDSKVNEKISFIERRIDVIERRLDQLASNFQNFMDKFERGSQIPRQYDALQERKVEKDETIPEIKLIGDRNVEPKRALEEDLYTYSRVAQKDPSLRDAPYARDSINSTSTFNVRDRVREALEQVVKRKEERRTSTDQNKERSEPSRLSETRLAPKEFIGNLRSPDTDKKRKNVSWSQVQSPDQRLSIEGVQKRQKFDHSGQGNGSKKLISGEYDERSKMLDRSYEKFEERINAAEIPNQRRSVDRRSEMPLYERYTAERNEMRLCGRKTSEKNEANVVEKDRLLEERRNKIDEEIERRIIDQVDAKKRVDNSIENLKEVYPREPPAREDSKYSPYSAEKFQDKEIVSRLVRERQMRNNLISKYSDTPSDFSKKFR